MGGAAFAHSDLCVQTKRDDVPARHLKSTYVEISYEIRFRIQCRRFRILSIRFNAWGKRFGPLDRRFQLPDPRAKGTMLRVEAQTGRAGGRRNS